MFCLVKKAFCEFSEFRNPTKYLHKNGAAVGEGVKFAPPFFKSVEELKYLTNGDKWCFSRPSFIFHDGNNLDFEHLGLSKPGKRKVLPITIGNNCCIGRRVMFLPGATIGNNSIVTAGVVTKRFLDNCVNGGSS